MAEFINETQFINENNYYFNVCYDFSRYSIDLQNADLSTKGIWISLLALLFQKDGRLVDWRGNKMQDEKAAEYLRIPLEQFKPALESLENWGVFQRDENGVLCNRWLIKQAEKIKSDRKAGAMRAKKSRDSCHSSNNNSECNANVRECNAHVTPERRVEKRKTKQNKKDDMREQSREEGTAPGGDDPPPVDNSTHSTHSLIYQFPKFCSYTEALAKLVETTGKTICNGIGESARRQAIESKLADIIEKGGDPVHWFAAMEEAINYASENPQKPAGEILAKFRQYPDGIQDNGKDSRCEQLIRVVSKEKPYGACSKFLGKSIPGNLGFSGNYDDLDTYELPQEEYDPNVTDQDNPF